MGTKSSVLEYLREKMQITTEQGLFVVKKILLNEEHYPRAEKTYIGNVGGAM